MRADYLCTTTISSRLLIYKNCPRSLDISIGQTVATLPLRAHQG